jgi:membrane protease YdiL (CAAX protease family)
MNALEPAAVFALIMAYIWIWRTRHPHAWVAILACMLLSHLLRDEGARGLGFGRRSLRECFHRFAPALTFLALLMFSAALLLNTTRRIPSDMAFLGLLAYIPWGILQQYTINGYFLNRFDQAFSRRAAAWLTAALFAAAHTPNLFLMPVALVGGWCAARVYRRYRNLYFLGIAHAAIGFLLFVTVPDSISHHLKVGPGMLLHQHVHRAIQYSP